MLIICLADGLLISTSNIVVCLFIDMRVHDCYQFFASLLIFRLYK
uniref:Uncharacterized protein n=1 Tax=Rhizophora mucronata TaxID=61149 RepID=A0A2P2R194_RHIMU